MTKRKIWAAKGNCPTCNVGTGSKHHVSCPNKLLTATEIRFGHKRGEPRPSWIKRFLIKLASF